MTKGRQSMGTQMFGEGQLHQTAPPWIRHCPVYTIIKAYK